MLVELLLKFSEKEILELIQTVEKNKEPSRKIIKNINTKTQYFPSLFDKEIADSNYLFLRDSTEWENGIYSKRKGKMSRKAYHADIFNDDSIDICIGNLVRGSLEKIKMTDKFEILGTYINYYRDGNDFAPKHNHPGQVQLVISLGATRTLIIGKKEYKMNSGDSIIFGSSHHEVPIEPDIKEGRISIATFMLRK